MKSLKNRPLSIAVLIFAFLLGQHSATGKPLIEKSQRTLSNTVPTCTTHNINCTHESISELASDEFYSHTTSIIHGMSPIHQLTEILGFGIGGYKSRSRITLGFPERTVSWDALAVEELYLKLLDKQSRAELRPKRAK